MKLFEKMINKLFSRISSDVVVSEGPKYVFEYLRYAMLCPISYHLYNLKNVKKTPWRSVSFDKVAG